MTAAKAIEIISRKSSIPNDGETFEDIEKAYDMAIEALVKQIPRKPLDVTMEYDGDYGKCPCCNRTVGDFHESKQCRNCGQMLDWGGANTSYGALLF